MSSQSDASAVAGRIEAQLAVLGTPERAASQKRYLKSDLHFLGATMGQVRGCVRATWSARPLSRPDALRLASALLAELRGFRAGGPLDPFLARADGLLEEREFFIRKAIGWVLREAGRRRPEAVAAWLGPRAGRASGVTMREATKYLAADDASRLMAAHRERRPAGGQVTR